MVCNSNGLDLFTGYRIKSGKEITLELWGVQLIQID